VGYILELTVDLVTFSTSISVLQLTEGICFTWLHLETKLVCPKIKTNAVKQMCLIKFPLHTISLEKFHFAWIVANLKTVTSPPPAIIIGFFIFKILLFPIQRSSSFTCNPVLEVGHKLINICRLLEKISLYCVVTYNFYGKSTKRCIHRQWINFGIKLGFVNSRSRVIEA